MFYSLMFYSTENLKRYLLVYPKKLYSVENQNKGESIIYELTVRFHYFHKQNSPEISLRWYK